MKQAICILLCLGMLFAAGCSCTPSQTPADNAENGSSTVIQDGQSSAVDGAPLPTRLPDASDEAGETPNANGLYNDPDTDATPEPKLTYEAYRAMNDDVIGWIDVPNTTIAYPVLYAGNNFYINHSPSRTRSDYGAIYLYENCAPTDKYLVLFGHAMKDGSMFAPLHSFSDRTFFEATPTFTYTYGDEVRTYRIFSTFIVDIDAEYASFMDTEMDDYVAFLEGLYSASAFRTDESFTFDENSEVVCLVTCNRVAYANGREVVLGLRQN